MSKVLSLYEGQMLSNAIGAGTLIISIACAGCPPPTPDTCGSPSLEVSKPRGSPVPVIVHEDKAWNYGPSVMLDGNYLTPNIYKMWWCGAHGFGGGDAIWYGTAPSLDGPWDIRQTNFTGTGDHNDFDWALTCDPSVVRINGTYYLYYTGADDSGDNNKIGVATSNDGITWTRANGGQPIIVPVRDVTTVPNHYGAGQPSVTFVRGLFYLAYTDTTGLGSVANSSYLLRSPDPTFQSNVQELGADGFHGYTDAEHTKYSLISSNSVDLIWVDALDQFAVGVYGGTVFLFDPEKFKGGRSVGIPGWDGSEGPGIVTRPDRHLVADIDLPTEIPFDLMTAVGPTKADIAHMGADFSSYLLYTCTQLNYVYTGYRLISQTQPLALVVDGQKLLFESSAPAQRLSHISIDIPDSIYNEIPYGATLRKGARTVAAKGRPGAFLLDDNRLWAVSCSQVVADNESTIEMISVQEWDSHARGPDLFCLE